MPTRWPWYVVVVCEHRPRVATMGKHGCIIVAAIVHHNKDAITFRLLGHHAWP
jgi:hypothetical protein